MSQDNEAALQSLEEALANRTPRYFRAGGGNAHGHSGYADTERFAEILMVMQECALLVGEKLEMSSVAYAYMYDGEETIGFRFDPNTNPNDPQVVGAIQNRRASMRDFTQGLLEYMESGR